LPKILSRSPAYQVVQCTSDERPFVGQTIQYNIHRLCGTTVRLSADIDATHTHTHTHDASVQIFGLPQVQTVIDLRGGGDHLPGPPCAHRVLVKFITPKAAMKILWGTGPSALFPAAASKAQGDSFKVAMAAKTFKVGGNVQPYRTIALFFCVFFFLGPCVPTMV
jgi:hypothetical protein